MTSAEYLKKLKDPKWQQKRLEVLQRDGFKCQFPNCKNTHMELHVHHKKYLPGNPWDTPLKYLIVYCKEHHELIHKIHKKTLELSKIKNKNARRG